MYRVKDICKIIEEFAPLAYQNSYDNAGLLTGNLEQKVTGVLLSLDITEAVIDNALEQGANMIVAHHPIIFKGLKKLTGRNYVERTVIKAIQNNISLYAAHTNLDNVTQGVSFKLCEKIGLTDCQILDNAEEQLSKLITFVPDKYAKKVRTALFDCGCGAIGNYNDCSFNTNGIGTFTPSATSTPFVGKKNNLHQESEIKIETIFPSHLQTKVIQELKKHHPYEEVAYDILPLRNKHPYIGSGCVGTLKTPEKTPDFLTRIKENLHLSVIRHTPFHTDTIQKVAVCGGSGSFLLSKAITSGADIFITGDFKYHEFFDADNKIIIADIGHYESEFCSLEIFYELITKKIPKFAVYFTNRRTNPINYFL